MSPLRKVAASPGATAIIALAALTAVEYLVSIAGVPAAFLWLTIIAVVKAGVIDPTKVVRSGLQNAASVASLLLTTDALVSDLPSNNDADAGGGHQH